MNSQKFIRTMVFLILLLACNENAFAQEQLAQGTGLQVSPIRFDWEMKSGEVRTGVVNIKNYTDGTRMVRISAENFFVTPDSEHANLFGGDPAHPRSAFNVIDWFTLPEDLVLEPGESRNVPFIVTIPDDQPTNGYYGTILFQTTNRTDADDSKRNTAEIEINYRVGAIVTLAVRGNDPPFIEGYVEDFFTEDQWYIQSPVTMITRITNTGNMHFQGSGEVVIERFGERMGIIEIGPEIYYPGAVRTLRKDFSFGMWDFGMYTAHIRITSEDDRIVLDATTGPFFVLPRDGLIVVGGVFGAIVLFFALFKYVFRISLRRDSVSVKKKKEKNLSDGPWGK
jgi:hypothetical protein